MNPTHGTRQQFRPTVVRFVPVVLLGTTVLALSACHYAGQAASKATHTAEPPAIELLSMPKSPDSTRLAARRAMSELGGSLLSIQWRPQVAVLSTRYTRNKHRPGMADIIVVATVARTVKDPLHPETYVELRAWAMDSIATRRTLGAPITTVETRMHPPRPITYADSLDWSPVQFVIQVLLERGAKRVASNAPTSNP